MLTIYRHGKFKRDVKKLSRSGAFDIEDLKNVIETLERNIPLDPQKYRPHKLIGNWQGYMGCHITSISCDWLLVYKIDEKQKTLNLARTGTHSELFG